LRKRGFYEKESGKEKKDPMLSAHKHSFNFESPKLRRFYTLFSQPATSFLAF
jgi:ribosomal protein S21